MNIYKYDRFETDNDFYTKKKKNKKLFMFIGRKRELLNSQYGYYLIQRQIRFEDNYRGVLFHKRLPSETPIYLVLVHKAVLLFKTAKYKKEILMYRKQQKNIPLTSPIYLLQKRRTN
tara:strand:+ start:234 stop:584 length:351 start_codon:yes stop_codon:yes gene_type:complete